MKRVQVQDETLHYLEYNAANWGHHARWMSACGLAELAGEAARIAVGWARMAEGMKQMFQII